jgi:hypothetical protein
MQPTDEVHYRFVHNRDGTLRSYAMRRCPMELQERRTGPVPG